MVSCCLNANELGKVIDNTMQFMENQNKVVCKVRRFYLKIGIDPNGPVPPCPPGPCLEMATFVPFSISKHFRELGELLVEQMKEESESNGSINIMIAPGKCSTEFCVAVNEKYNQNTQIARITYHRTNGIVTRGKFLIFKIFYINFNSFLKRKGNESFPRYSGSEYPHGTINSWW